MNSSPIKWEATRFKSRPSFCRVLFPSQVATFFRASSPAPCALNCVSEGERPCGACIPCSKIDRGIHPDVEMVEPDGANIRIEQVREIERKLTMAAYEGRKRVYILDPADALGLEAANAFLKTLEEPPSDTMFVLVTDKFSYLLPTILSRCQHIPFYTLKLEEVARIVAEQEGIEEEKARLAASYARGRLGAALRMDVDGFINLREELLEKWFRLSSEDGEKMLELAASLTASARSAGKARIEPLNILITWFRDLALLKSGAEKDSLVHKDMMWALETEQEKFSLDELNECFQALHQTILLLNTTNVNKELAITAMLVRMLTAKRGAGRGQPA